MSSFQFFILLSLFYVAMGIACLVRVVLRWRLLWDDQVTTEDLELASRAAFYLLIPPTVALHELGHAVLVWAQGREVIDWMFLGYMGAVLHETTGALGDFAIALAGNVVTLVIGVVAVLLPLYRPGHPIRNTLWLEVGRRSLFLVLAFYPAVCLFFPGDFVRIYDFEETPIASGAVAIVHASLLIFGYGLLWKKRWRPRASLICSPLAKRLIEMESRLAVEPDDPSASRELGLLHFAASDFAKARLHLERLVEKGRLDAKARAVYGAILVEAGEPAKAIPHLEAALEGILRPEDRLLAEIPLARAWIAEGERARARMLLEKLTAAHPKSGEIRDLYERVR